MCMCLQTRYARIEVPSLAANFGEHHSHHLKRRHCIVLYYECTNLNCRTVTTNKNQVKLQTYELIADYSEISKSAAWNRQRILPIRKKSCEKAKKCRKVALIKLHSMGGEKWDKIKYIKIIVQRKNHETNLGRLLSIGAEKIYT